MALIKETLTDTPDGKWQLVYDTERRALYVESSRGKVSERIGIDTALGLPGDGADELRLRIVDLFKGQTSPPKEPHTTGQ